MDLETLVVAFGADLAGLTKGVSGAKALLAGFGLSALGVGVASTKMAGDFQAGMLTIKTGAGGVNENIAQLSQSVLDLSDATGTGTKGLIDGLFMIESAGQRGATAMDTLKMVTEGAKVGNADLGVTAKGVTAIMTDFASQNITAAQATNTLIATVGDGETTMQDLAGSMSSILPVASSMQIKLSDVMGAMATMTGETVPAADAATYLRQMIMSLSAPSKAASTSLEEIGLSAQQVSDGIKVSLPDTLKLIEEHLKKKFPEGSIAYTDALKNIAGGSKQMQGLLDLTGSHLQTFGDNVKDISGKVKTGGDSIVGWSDVQGTFNFKMDQAKTAVEGLMIKIGTALLPSLGKLFDKIGPLITKFGDWLTKSGFLKTASDALGKAIDALPGIIDKVTSSIQASVKWYKQNKETIDAVAFALTVLYTPAVIKAGVEAVVAGTKTTTGFVANIVKAGMEGWAAAGKLMIWIGNVIASGTQAVIAGAKITASFIASIAKTAAQAVVSGAIIAAQFISKIVLAGTQAVITGAQFVASLIPAIVSMTASAITAAVTAIPGLIVGFISWTAAAWAAAAATIAATWPILLVIAGIALLVAGIVLLITHWKQISDFTLMIWGHIVDFFQNDVVKPISHFFDMIGSKIHDALDGMGKGFNAFGTIVHNIWDGIVSKVKDAINWIIGGINNFIGFIDKIQIHIPAFGVGPLHTPAMDWNGLGIPKIPLLASGGSAQGPFIAGERGPELIFPNAGGATVLNNSQTRSALGGQQNVHVHVYLDGQELTNQLGHNLVSMARTHGAIGALL